MNKIFLVMLLIFSVFLYSCTNAVQSSNRPITEIRTTETVNNDEPNNNEPSSDEPNDDGTIEDNPKVNDYPEWMDISLSDVRTGKSFKISDFSGKPILIESFAVWCPTCKKQQDKTKEFHEIVGDSVVSIALDTDPNEDESKILDHVTSNGYDWLYAISPVELTQKLIDEFGIGVVSAPSVPVILVCEDHSFRMLGSGVKSPEKLQSEIQKGCL